MADLSLWRQSRFYSLQGTSGFPLSPELCSFLFFLCVIYEGSLLLPLVFYVLFSFWFFLFFFLFLVLSFRVFDYIFFNVILRFDLCSFLIICLFLLAPSLLLFPLSPFPPLSFSYSSVVFGKKYFWLNIYRPTPKPVVFDSDVAPLVLVSLFGLTRYTSRICEVRIFSSII